MTPTCFFCKEFIGPKEWMRDITIAVLENGERVRRDGHVHKSCYNLVLEIQSIERGDK